MAAYKVPKIVRFVNALPRSTVGKVLRRELRNVARPERRRTAAAQRRATLASHGPHQVGVQVFVHPTSCETS
jgi:hypothetical protein